MNEDIISRSEMKKAFGKWWGADDIPTTVVEDLIDSARPVQIWTPCSERQPESDGVYYVTVTFNGKSITRDQVFHERRWLPLGKLLVNGVSGEPEVIAWMEKPEPYKEPEISQEIFGRGV